MTCNTTSAAILPWFPTTKCVNARGHRSIGISQGFQLVIASGAAAATVVTCVGLVSVFNHEIMEAKPRLAIQTTLIHDIAGVSVRADQNLMPDYVVKTGVDLALLKERYTPRYHDPLSFNATRNVPMATTPAEFTQLSTAWRNAVMAHPIDYMRHRMATFIYLLDIAQPNPSELYQGHTDSNAAKYCQARKAQHLDDPGTAALSLYRDDVMPELLKTYMFRGYAYDVVGLMLLLWTMQRVYRSGAVRNVDQLIITIVLMVGLHQIALFFFAPSAFFRYLTPTVVSCLVMILLLVSRRDSNKHAPDQPCSQASYFSTQFS